MSSIDEAAVEVQPVPKDGKESVFKDLEKNGLRVGSDVEVALLMLLALVREELYGNAAPKNKPIDTLRARVALGVSRYGQELKTHDGRNALVDCYQELLDALMYYHKHLMEKGS